MINRIIDDINVCLENKAYLAALSLALTLPDICGKALYPSSGPRDRYITWYDRNIGQYEHIDEEDDDLTPYLSGELIYKLRNNLFHEGNLDIEKDEIHEERNKIDCFKLIVSDNKNNIIAGFITSSKEYKELEVEIRLLCNRITSIAKKEYNENKDKFNFMNTNIINIDELYKNRGL